MNFPDIETLEATIGWRLPEDYRTALSLNFENVGKVSDDVYIGAFFLSLHEADGFGLLQQWDMFKKKRLLPFALTMGGDRLLIDAKGRVHRWFHETSRIVQVYDSFATLAGLLS